MCGFDNYYYHYYYYYCYYYYLFIYLFIFTKEDHAVYIQMILATMCGRTHKPPHYTKQEDRPTD